MARFNQYLYDPSDPDLVSKVQADIPEFNFSFREMDKLLAYTVHVYDPHTDLLKLFPTDFYRRKREAALMAGFTIDDSGKFSPDVEDCLVGANDDYNAAIVAFVTRFNSLDLLSYVMYREVFTTEMRASMSAPDSKSKREAIVNAENARIKLTELEKKLFTDDEVVSVRNALYVLAEKLRLSLRPEDIAMAIERKELDLPDPYYPKAVTEDKPKRGRPRDK